MLHRILISLTLFSAVLTGYAQVANNTLLVGTVRDPSGAVVPGAQVTGLNRDTKVEYPGTTNTEGYYSIPFVLPGTYDVVVDKPGFRKVTSTGVMVTLNLAVRTDVVLTVGSTNDVVTVSAETPALSTDDAVVGETINAKQVENLPMNTRRVLELASTASNIIVGTKTSYTGVPPGADFIGAGTREITNSLTLDGITIMNSLISTSPVTPNPDAVAAVQTQTGNYTAQYGAYMGVHINVDTRSGANQIHGTAYDYVQNDFFNAKNWTTPSSARTPVLRFNQFGGVFDGPLVIPHLYNGRDKTFFMGSYEGLRQINQTQTTATVITGAERTGNFASLCTAFTSAGLCAAGQGTQIYNPFNHTPYVNNQITNVSPYAQALLAYYPHPNLAGGASNLNVAPGSVFNKNATLDRLDYNIGEKVRLFARYTYERSNAVNGNVVATSASYSPTTDSNGVLGFTYIITPRLINDLRLGYNKFASNQLNYFYVNGPQGAGTALGIPGFTADTTNGNPGVPTVLITNFTGLGAEGTNWFQDDRTLQGYDQISYTLNKHTLMAGADIRRMTISRAAQNQNRGQFNFNGSYTGNAAADFLTGAIYQTTTPVTQVKGSVGEYRDGFFVQDNWQVSQKLTLLYGFRYELPTVPYSLNGYARILNSSYTGLIPASNATSGATFVPTPGFQFIGPNHNLFSPRLGLAYRATDKIVVRAGGGIYYNPNQLNSFTLASSNYPLAASVVYTGNLGTSTQPAIANQSFANPTGGGPGAPALIPGTRGTYLSAFNDNPYLPTPRLYQWNLDTGVELWKNAAFELQYLGSRSIHLDRSLYPNQPLPGPGNVNARRPYQLFGAIRQIQNDGFETYNGLTAILRQHAYRGLDTSLSYTWSHTLDTSTDSNGGGTPMIQYNLKADYGNANWDIRSRFVGTVAYALPELAQFGAVTRSLMGGWQANTIVILQSGMPINVAITNDQANVGGIGTQRPNYVHAPRSICSRSTYTSHTNQSCLDATAYALPAPYTFGNSHRNDISGPGQINVNFSMFKNFPLYERLSAQFRAEAFNLFNHPNPQSPGNGVTTLPSANSAGGFTLTQSTTFGTIIAAQNNGRVLQLAAKINF